MGELQIQLFGQSFWMVLIILFCVIEGITFGLVCIWFAVGSIAALIASAIGFSPLIQYAVFVVASVALLIFTRPLLSRFLITRKASTNADRLIGMTGMVTTDIDPISASGQVKVDGQVWSAKTTDGSKIGSGVEVDIIDISGVKLVVKVRNNVQ